MVEVSTPSRDLKPSPELFEMIQAAASSLTGFAQLWESIRKKGTTEGFTETELQDLIKPLLKAQLHMSKEQIWYMFNKEKKEIANKESYQKRRINLPNDDKKELEHLELPDPVELPLKQGIIDEEDEEEPTPLELAEIEIQQLKDALHKTQQFRPATQLQEQPTRPKENPTPELQLTDDLVFQYLRDRAKETGNILIIDRVGAGALVQALAQYKNSFGVAELFLRVIK